MKWCNLRGFIWTTVNQGGEAGRLPELWLTCLLSLLLLSFGLTSASFLSTKFMKLVVRLRRLVLTGSISSTSDWVSGLNLRYCDSNRKKNTDRATKQAIPQIRNNPQKLLSDSWFTSTWFRFVEHSVRDSHLSWIFWRSPFSESWRMAVDKSTARGESLWNA